MSGAAARVELETLSLHYREIGRKASEEVEAGAVSIWGAGMVCGLPRQAQEKGSAWRSSAMRCLVAIFRKGHPFLDLA